VPEHLLTKSQFLAGLQCHRRLWWQVHEPDAPELCPDEGLQWTLVQGREVGMEARARLPTLQAEVGLRANRAYARLDLLEPLALGYGLIEVKSATSVHPEHLHDVAFQADVARATGLGISRTEVMHLNADCRYPDLRELFVRAPVDDQIAPLLPMVATEVARQHTTLAGSLPEVRVGEHCRRPRECPFLERCWAHEPEHHVRTLYAIRGQTAEELEAGGFHTIGDIPADFPLPNPIHLRQREAVQSGRLYIGPALAEALEAFQAPIAFLDFETVSTAIPRFPGSGPWMNVPAQVSIHRYDEHGNEEHIEWLADGPTDPRPGVAEAVVRGCRGVRSVVAYFASFEARCLEHLALAVPELAEPLLGISGRLVDLLPIVRDHVYHPDFRGSFSLKRVLPALVPELSYEGMAIAEGAVATARIGRLMFDPPARAEDRSASRQALLEYCRQDTLAMMRLLERLRTLATS
jgi:hypothetical protein